MVGVAGIVVVGSCGRLFLWSAVVMSAIVLLSPFTVVVCIVDCG